MGTFVLVMIVILVVIGVAVNRNKLSVERSKCSRMTPDELKNYEGELKWGPLSAAYICPHCRTTGFVRTTPVQRKRGISGAKATGAVLTAGFSILATGLSRKEGLTQAHCDNCNCTWDF